MVFGPRLMQGPAGGGKVPKGGAVPIRIEARIGVQAPAAVIWELLGDLPTWAAWCPIYPRAEGLLRINERLSLTLALPGLPEREITPRVIDWMPEEQILWADTAWRGWAKSVRYIEVDVLSETGCIIANGEQFEGMFSELFAEKHRKALKKGFIAFNEALKEQAETLWQDRQRKAR